MAVAVGRERVVAVGGEAEAVFFAERDVVHGEGACGPGFGGGIRCHFVGPPVGQPGFLRLWRSL